VNFAFDEDQEALRESARKFLQQIDATARARATVEAGGGHDLVLWRELAAELGWAAISISEDHGGFGMGTIALVAVIEELGAYTLGLPLLGTLGLATPALSELADDAQRDRWLTPIAAGELTATLALTEAGGRPDLTAVRTTATDHGDDVVVDGDKALVIDGGSAELILVVARHRDGLSVVALDRDTPGVTATAQPTLDVTRPLASLSLRGVRVPRDRVLGAAGQAEAGLGRTLARAYVALAAEQAGSARRCLEQAVDYAGVRRQFGRPIGSFQSIKHKCADMMVHVESARSAAWFAAWTADHAPEELVRAAHLAKATCSEALFRCAADNVQIHGGIGFTWEHDAHLFLKRARTGLDLLGDPAWHRERYADLVLDARPN
jgi:alkylation response protein AidB-like acyl-CoA dehydrogenase